jgi:hypothetical protein
LPDRAGDEPIGLAEDVDYSSHGTSDPTAITAFEQARSRPDTPVHATVSKPVAPTTDTFPG